MIGIHDQFSGSFKSLLIFTLAAVLFCFAPLRAQSNLNLRFGVYTSEKPVDLQRKVKPALVYLEKALAEKLSRPVRIRLRIFRSYETARMALVQGYVDFSRFGPASYLLSKKQNSRVGLLAVEEKKGTHFFKGVIATRQGSAVRSVKDIPGRRFAFGDPTSTIGRYLAQSFLIEAGIYADDLAGFDYLMRHDKVAEAILKGTHDVGAMKESTFKKNKAKGLVEVATFKNITKPWVHSPKLDPMVRHSISDILLGIKDEKVLAALGKGISGFIPPDDSLYSFVEEGMKKAEQFTQKAATGSGAK